MGMGDGRSRKLQKTSPKPHVRILMTEECYEYDEGGYEARLQKLLQRSKKVRQDLENSNYESLEKLLKEKEKVERLLENILNELEVEHFLMNGPQGKDPI
jgi:chromatin segregation and condensation protein Rec8/ScpA/Scc1 (kleisin family)